jgi:tetratricopeptide (TPR) repeat protein
LYKRSTNYEGALVEFENCLKIDPNFAPAYREKGETYFKMRNMEKAKENYKKYLELSRNNSNARLRYAYFLFESEDFKSAQAELDKITKADSSNLYMMRIIGYVALENEFADTARRALNKVFTLTAEDTTKRISKDYAYYGRTLARTGNDSLGMEYLSIAIETDPRYSEHYDDLGKMATKAKKHHVSVNVYRKKIERHHKVNSSDYYNLGRALYSNKEFVAADSAFVKVTELSPNWATGYLYLGRTRSQIDTLYSDLSAIPPYEKYIALTSADSASIAKYSKELIESNSYIAVAYLRKKDCTRSLEFWNRVLAIDPKVQQATDAIKIIKDSKDCK